MQIPSDNQPRPIETPPKPLSASYAQSSGATPAPAAKQTASPTSALSDQLALGTTTGSDIGRYVQILKNMSPSDQGKVDQLRSRIRDGSYTATASELAEPLSAILGGSSGNGSSGRQST